MFVCGKFKKTQLWGLNKTYSINVSQILIYLDILYSELMTSKIPQLQLKLTQAMRFVCENFRKT